MIENFSSLKNFLLKEGYNSLPRYRFEVYNLIAYHYEQLPAGEDRFIDAVSTALGKSRGAYGIAVMCIDYPDMMVGARARFSLSCWNWRGCQLYCK